MGSKKHRGNLLTKQEQPQSIFNQYLYNNGFSDRFYICSYCDSNKLTPILKGGMSPPSWKCDNCGEMNYAPKWISPDEWYNDRGKRILKVFGV